MSDWIGLDAQQNTFLCQVNVKNGIFVGKFRSLRRSHHPLRAGEEDSETGYSIRRSKKVVEILSKAPASSIYLDDSVRKLLAVEY